MSEKKPWGGRFTEPTDKFVEEFTQSVSFDKRLYRYDIAGSIVHARMLGKQGIISAEDAGKIIHGLEQVLEEIEEGKFEWRTDLEDVHMNIEARLTEKVGEAGKRLHTGRSRNDQVALDIKMYVKDEILNLAGRAGIQGADVFEVDASRQSNKINAYVTGLFNTKRIVLYDTTIKAMTTDQLLFIMGHEMGHYVLKHIAKTIILISVLTILALWFVHRTSGYLIRRYRKER